MNTPSSGARPGAASDPIAQTCATDAGIAGDGRVEVPLYRLAHGRTGDKGDISNISVIAWEDALFPLLMEQLTESAVYAWFAFRKPARVMRYPIASIAALNFVIEGVLDGGVNDALNLDAHGKALSFHLLDFPMRVPAGLAARLPDIHQP